MYNVHCTSYIVLNTAYTLHIKYEITFQDLYIENYIGNVY